MRRWVLLMLLMILAGCGAPGGPASGPKNASGDVFGEAVRVALLEPYQGKWRCDFERTLATWQLQGVSPETISQMRAMRAKMQSVEVPPELEKTLKAQGIDPQTWRDSAGNLWQDLTIAGHITTGSGSISEEYRFFALHEHDGAVCGKAWHHEDRFDPGDMSKCHVKLSLIGGELHLDVRMQEQIDLNDPDLIGSPPIVLDDAASCDAPAATGIDRNGWSTYVFVRSLTGPAAPDPAN